MNSVSARLTLLATCNVVLLVGGLALAIGQAALPWTILVLTLSAVTFITYLVQDRAVTTEMRKSLQARQGQIELIKSDLARRQTTIDALGDGLETAIFICDTRATIQYANRRACEVFQFPNPIGMSVLAVTLSVDLEQIVLGTAQDQDVRSKEVTFSYPEEKIGLAGSWPSPDGDRIFLSVYEITDLRRLERVRQDFVSNVSHELRTPLTVIRTMAETLLDDPSDNSVRERYLSRMIDEVDRLTHLSADLLTLSIAEGTKTVKAECNLAGIFRENANSLTAKAKEKGLKLDFEAPEDITAIVSANQMSQVAVNLIDNALNYTSEGGVKITLRQEDGWALIEVSDTGIGIASDELPRIFERFYRVDKGRSRDTGGTGLGLSIVKHIVESHGGAISVESNLNQGSTFRIRLPRNV